MSRNNYDQEFINECGLYIWNDFNEQRVRLCKEILIFPLSVKFSESRLLKDFSLQKYIDNIDGIREYLYEQIENNNDDQKDKMVRKELVDLACNIYSDSEKHSINKEKNSIICGNKKIYWLEGSDVVIVGDGDENKRIFMDESYYVGKCNGDFKFHGQGELVEFRKQEVNAVVKNTSEECKEIIRKIIMKGKWSNGNFDEGDKIRYKHGINSERMIEQRTVYKNGEREKVIVKIGNIEYMVAYDQQKKEWGEGIDFTKGRIIYEGGDIYEGDFSSCRMSLEDEGYPNKGFYNREREGQGEYIIPEKNFCYKGEFKDNKIDGNGTIIYNDMKYDYKDGQVVKGEDKKVPIEQIKLCIDRCSNTTLSQDLGL